MYNLTNTDNPDKSQRNNKANKYLISAQELLQRLHDENILLIDVRMPYELKNEGKIGQSINIPCKLIIDFIVI